MRWVPSVIGVVVLLAQGGAARADSPAESTARAAKLFDEGRELARQGHPKQACDRFAQSLELVRAVGTELNLADCLEKQGKLARAWELFDEAARVDAEAFPARAQMARGRAEKLAARLVTIVVKPAEPAGLTISIAGAAVPTATEILRRVDPGPIEVIATGPDRPRFAKSVIGAEGARIVIEIPGANPVTTPPPPVPPARPSSKRRSRLYFALGLGGGGVLAFAGGELLGLSAHHAYDDQIKSGACREAGGKLTCASATATARIDDANSKANLATGVIVVGAALVAGAAVVYFTAPRDRETTVVPTAGGNAVGVAVLGRF